MKYNNWTPNIGDYIPAEDDYTKKHIWMLKREKIKKSILLSSLFVFTSGSFILMLYIVSKI